MIEKFTPENVGATLEGIGVAYSIETDPRGFPMLIVDARRLPVQQFNIMFFSCDKVSSECDDIALWAWYDMGPVSEKAIFAWNDPFQGRRWSTGYIDQDDDPALVMNINATGGIGERALQILVNTYVEDLFAFRDLLKDQKVSENDTGSSRRAEARGASLVDGEVLGMIELVKDYGAESFAHTKEAEKKE
jgi:hypothetical protein